MPVIEVKLYDSRVTEESVPKMIEALTEALHESSGAAKERGEGQPASGFTSPRDAGPAAPGRPKPAGTFHTGRPNVRICSIKTPANSNKNAQATLTSLKLRSRSR